MVVLGSLLVFVTFIVNEAIRDNLKNYIASLKQAQSMFVLQRDHAAILVEMESVNRKEFETEQFITPHEVVPIARLLKLQNQRFAHEAILFGEFGREFMRAGRSFLSLADLLSNAPVDASYRTKTGFVIMKLMSQEDDLQHELESTSKLIQKEGAALQRSDLEAAVESSRQIRARFNTIQDKTDDFSNALDAFSHDQFNEVNDTTDKLNSGYDTVTTISYFLYAIGSGFALLGKLYGIEVSSV